jgi:hypothetical protein
VRRSRAMSHLQNGAELINDDSFSDSHPDPDKSTILRYLIRRGNISFITSDGSDNEDDSDTTDDSGYVYQSHRRHNTPLGIIHISNFLSI